MKIAYLNPWVNRAENQACSSLAAAARKLGVELVDCRVPEQIEMVRPDFVLSVASNVPKGTDFPSYLTIHQPKKLFLETSIFLRNLLTYDGFLTISDTLERFIVDACFGVGRHETPGFYYNSPQTTTLTADIPGLVREQRLRLGYFGTNWDRRRPALFRALDHRGFLRIHGPSDAWEQDSYRSYAGPLPFDGVAPQHAYAEYGMGLVLPSDVHLQEDIISNRIFEISSVGAVSLCPDTPWIRKWFGDSVLYFNPYGPAGNIARQILAHYRFCNENPRSVQEMALRARAIFEESFSAERMLANLVDYHEMKQRAGARRLAHLKAEGEPTISVVIRCGGRPVEWLKIAVSSIRRQTFGRFVVILSKYRDVDLAEITRDRSGPIERFVEVLTPGGGRAATLSAGLRHLGTEYFSVLDDDDYWLSDHFESLFLAARKVDPHFDMAFSGVITKTEEAAEIDGGLRWHRNIYLFGFRREPSMITDITGDIGTNSFVARTDLITDDLADLPLMESAEDSLLAAFISRRKRPVFSYKATAFLLRGFVEQSGWEKLSSRRKDVLTFELRSGLLFSPPWLNQASVEPALRAWRNLPADLPDAASIPRPALLEALGEPVLSDEFEEGWELLGRMLVGKAGRRSGSTIVARQLRSGHVCYGPYIRLPPSRYRVEVELAAMMSLRVLRSRSSGRALGAVDVVAVAANWGAAAARFQLDDRRVTIEFETTPALSDKLIEFRVASFGFAGFTIRSIRLWHTG